MLSPRGGRPHDAPSPSSKSPRHADMGAGGCGRVLECEAGLPTAEELTPLSHPLIPRALAAAFRIDVAGASSPFVDSALLERDSPTSHLSFRCDDDDDEDDGGDEDAAPGPGGGACRVGKVGMKKRMVWTAVLHRRFVEAVAHLGEKAAVPKAIVEVMNVEGITRENVASHLQKYRLYLKRTRTHAAPPGPRPCPRRTVPRSAPNRLLTRRTGAVTALSSPATARRCNATKQRWTSGVQDVCLIRNSWN